MLDVHFESTSRSETPGSRTVNLSKTSFYCPIQNQLVEVLNILWAIVHLFDSVTFVRGNPMGPWVNIFWFHKSSYEHPFA